jgi:hypothetical protein
MLPDQGFDVRPERAFFDNFAVRNPEEAARSQNFFHFFANGETHLVS